MNIEDLIDLAPMIHRDAAGDPITWAMSAEVLRELGSLLPPDSRTIETGCGLSTLFFALLRHRHTSVTPFREEHLRVRDFCDRHGIADDLLTLVSEPAEDYLPHLRSPDFDMFLVDGRHAFPNPFLDWFYGARCLKRGGLMVIDDTHILTGQLLVDFLEREPRWERVKKFPMTAIFRKLTDNPHEGDWTDQPWVFETEPRFS